MTMRQHATTMTRSAEGDKYTGPDGIRGATNGAGHAGHTNATNVGVHVLIPPPQLRDKCFLYGAY